MTVYVCFYDEDANYDSDVPYDGLCPPEILPVEIPLIIVGQSRKPTPSTQEYCYIEIDFIECYIDGELVPCGFKKIKFECEEETDKIPRFMIDSVKFTNSSNLDDIWFDVTNYAIKGDDDEMIIQMDSMSVEEIKNDMDIVLEDFDVDDLEIIIEAIVKKGSS